MQQDGRGSRRCWSRARRAQCDFKIANGLKALRWFFFETLQNRAFDRNRHCRLDLVRRNGRFPHLLQRDRDRIVRLECRSAGEDFVHDQAERVDIRPVVNRLFRPLAREPCTRACRPSSRSAASPLPSIARSRSP